jgi:mannose-6-phosphate isomerase-like protein (cupin superfamily)
MSTKTTIEQEVMEKENINESIADLYADFQKQEGIPVYRGYSVPDLRAVKVGPWRRVGATGAYVNLLGEEVTGDNYILEIPPGEKIKPQKHMFEELVYVLSGRGATTFWTKEGGPKWTFEWHEQSLFALPANMGYQHFNGDSTKPARLFSKTTLPVMLEYFNSMDFIFKNDYEFPGLNKDSYSAEAKVYKKGDSNLKGEENGIVWSANFVPDVRAYDKMTDLQTRGAGGTGVVFQQPGLARIHAHMSEFPVATYKKAHAHPPGRSIILVKGKGYSLLWEPGHPEDKKRVDWKPGGLFGVGLSDIQGEIWWHQHFNTGSEPARYLVLHVDPKRILDKHVQIEYVDEEPEIRQLYESELAKSGIKTKMPPECYTDRNYKWKKFTD